MQVIIELDDLNELHERINSLENELANQTYKGNSIGYIYGKMENYGNQALQLSKFVRVGVKEGYINVDKNDSEAYKILEMCGAIE